MARRSVFGLAEITFGFFGQHAEQIDGGAGAKNVNPGALALLRAGSHLVIAGSRHEILQEQDRYRAQFWAAFDAFVPGTPLFK